MKKIIPFTLMTLSLLVACTSPSSSTSEEVVIPPLVISKIITGVQSKNNVIELYNPSEVDVDVTAFSLDFYGNGSLSITTSITLEGMIEADSYFVLVGSNHVSDALLTQADQVINTGSLPFNGNDVIELSYQGLASDRVGIIGLDIDYSKNATFIRTGEKETYQPSLTYSNLKYIRYLPDLYSRIGNDGHELKTLDQMMEGPRLESRYLSNPFIDPIQTTLGGGGVVTTTNQSIADGDTATFAASGQFGGGSVRYYYINTPEVNGNYVDAEPWGYVASKYNKEFLMKNPNSLTLQIQSIPGAALREVNNRSLGLVWINGHLAQFLIVKEGLSEDVGLSPTSQDLLLSYKEVPFLSFLQVAEANAIAQGWGTKGYPRNVEGEKSPDWNYTAFNGVGGLATTNPVWTPHFDIPWDV
jgi:micrococcal nuclease